MRYVIARNRGKRPTLMHAVKGRETLCGTPMVGWTRAYSQHPIEPLLCLRCKAQLGEQADKPLRVAFSAS